MTYSIKRQIVVAVLLSQLILALSLALATIIYTRRQWQTAFDVMLEGRADSVLAALHDSEDDTGSVLLDRHSLNLPPSDLLEVRDDKDRLIWRSENWKGAPASALAKRRANFKFATSQASYVGVVLHKVATFEEEDNKPGPPRLITIAYASSTAELEARTRKIALFATISSLLLMAITSLFAAWSVNRGLASMQELAREADRISVRNWTFNPPPAARKIVELSPLVRALEAALAGLERAFSRQRDFIADAAHELKTAVAILKSSLQLLIYQPRSVQDYHAGLVRSLDDCGRMEALVCDMLALARAEQMADEGHRTPLQSVELAGSCEQVVANLHSLAEALGVEIRCTSESEIYVRSDHRDLETVWTNLLQNAIQHSPSGSIVSIAVKTSQPGSASVQIQDAGAGIPEEQLPHIFERFRRGDPSRSRATGGFGLGLSICEAIVNAYGGRIQIESSNGHGTCISVTLPTLEVVPSQDNSAVQ